ncbi:ATP-binding protein [Solimicrobium silvestre]|uniref:histidine kinase n=1 Tax=Solimicrobium silvestre TaxID=2099400 RepID=A0A2S9H3U4_9BURK|nr:ATP-binding protein [Solimicrobium silvestre]PRC94652.1 PAS domain S-box protein [Solimicrobium silvestre]
MSSTTQKFVQSRWPWLAASLILTVALFVSSTLGWLWYADQRDAAARELSLDLLWLEQNVTQTLSDNEHMLDNWARDLQTPSAHSYADFLSLADGLMKENPALISIDYLNKNGQRVIGLPNYTERPAKLPPVNDPLITEAIQRCYTLKKPVFSRVIEQYAPLWVMVVPVSDEVSNEGVVLATYDLDQLLSLQVPWWFVQRYDLSLVDRDNKQLSPHDGSTIEVSRDVHKLNFGPDNSGLSLRASSHAREHSEGLLLWLSAAVVAFGLLIIWLLRLLQRWLRERQIAQQALSHELRFREAMEQSLVTGLLAFDKAGRIIYVNPALCNMLGLSAESLIGSSAPFPFWPQENLNECQAAHDAMLRGDNPDNGRRLNLMDADGTRLSVRLFASRLASPIVNGDNKQNGWMVSLYDTTELQKEREALASSREQLYAVLSGLDAAVYVSSLSDGRVLFRNRHHAALFRFDAEGDCCLICWPELMHGSELTSVEFRDRQSGRWYHLERRTILWVDNSPVLLDIATDISAKREAADTAQERDELLQHTARLANLAEFASGIAHELNQPLAAIANYSAAADAFLEAQPVQTAKVHEAVRRMGDESRRAGKIIHSMRSFIQKRAIRHDFHHLKELLTEPLALLAPLAQRLQVEIVLELLEEEITIECDAVMIEQVLFNLIRNALEAVAGSDQTDEGVIVRIERDDENVTVSVSDRGPGIQEPDKLFQPFYTTKSEGMGLGLAICRTVIESHGGRLWAEANVGGGARFSFRLRCNAFT